MNFFEKLKILSASFAAIIIPLIMVFLGNQYSQAIKDKEARLKLVELSIQILIQKQGNENEGLRKWAIAIINKYSEVPLNEIVTDQLIRDKINFPVVSQPAIHFEPQTLKPVVPNLEKALQEKSLFPLLREAYTFIKGNDLQSNAYLKASKKFRDVLSQLPPSALSSMDKKIKQQADEYFNNIKYEDACNKYKDLFDEYYNYYSDINQ